MPAAKPARTNRYPHPATPIPHFVVIGRIADRGHAFVRWFGRSWPTFDLVLWACVVAVAGMDILTTVVGLEAGVAREGNGVGAAAWATDGAVGLLQLKLAVSFAIIILWIVVPFRLRGYVRAGTLAGGTLTYAAAAHNAWILLAAT